ncbi:MAG: AzlC family ABC transporter permease [Rubrivivax sp.]
MPIPRTPLWRDPDFRQGAHDMAEISLGVAAWGLIAGVTMVKTIGLPLALAMSLLVYAGSAQLAALPLIAGGAPLWVVWVTAVCVNLRFVVFSAGLRPYFGHLPRAQRLRLAFFAADLNYIVFVRRYPVPRPEASQRPYFWGGALVTMGAWQGASLLGIALADRIPASWDVGFAGTLALIALTCSLLTDRATWLAAAVAGSAALAAFALPLKMNLLVAIAAAIAVGSTLDQWPRQQRPRQRHEEST